MPRILPRLFGNGYNWEGATKRILKKGGAGKCNGVKTMGKALMVTFCEDEFLDKLLIITKQIMIIVNSLRSFKCIIAVCCHSATIVSWTI